MKTYSFYDSASGILHPMQLSCTNPDDLRNNIPAGHEVIEGRFSFRTHRVDPTTREVVHHQPEPDRAGLAREARARRDRMLSDSEWTQAADATLAGAQIAAWRAYRQALRDVPQQPGFPITIDWPAAP